MNKSKMNHGWKMMVGSPSLMSSLMGGAAYTDVSLPHDAMIHEERKEDTGHGAQTGFYPGGCYTYIRTLFAPEEWISQTVLLEFEGVYETAMVYVNGELAKTNLYGYSNFYVCLDKYLNYGAENEIKVIANNSAEKNTRWYSGSGIYRDVNLYVGNRIHIETDGVKILPVNVSREYAQAEVVVNVKNLQRKREDIQVKTTLLFHGEVKAEDCVHVTMFTQAEEEVHQRIGVVNPALWNVDTPNLYQCKVEILSEGEVLDTVCENFGFRTITVDPVHGFCINGETVKLRGTCIHHDNGVIGAATFADAERRRCRQMKEAGFNSIRSAHHPMSKAMLDACDEYGMLVMDEVSDIWTRHKNQNDFALHFERTLDEEIEKIVHKDYNHPSVIMYSTGNEIPEMGSPFGAQINRYMSNLFRRLDRSRFTTNAINGMLAAGSKMGVIIKELMEQFGMANQKQEDEENGASAEGAGELNGMLAMMTGSFADAFASHPLMTEIISESSEGMDIIGLNYMTGRHELEHTVHPNQCVVGTETYPADIVRLWDIVKNNDHVIGDYTWTGYDYLGEAGCGIFYYDGKANFGSNYPDRLAYIGDINLIGTRRPISYLREIVFGLRKDPYIAVQKVDKYGMKHSQTAWMDVDNIESWTWPGYEGKPAVVEIFGVDEEVELFLNGKSLGRKPCGEKNGFRTAYEITYEPGELKAIGYTDGKASAPFVLKTADEKVEMQVNVEHETLKADSDELAFITVRLVDAEGALNTAAAKEISITMDGPAVLQGFGNGDPQALTSYDATTWPVYEGEVMAVLRAGEKAGKTVVTFAADGMETKSVEVIIE